MSKANLLDRRKVVKTLLADRKDALVVGGLGATTYDLAAAGDHARNFALWGAMGGAVMIGLGLALAQPKLPVVVITGDGEMLMGMGSLATVGLQKPSNLTIIVLDNECYGETGGQVSHTSGAADLVGVAKACGIRDARTLETMSEIEERPEMSECASCVPRQASNDLCLYLTDLKRQGLAMEDFDPKSAAAMLMGAIFADAMGRDMMPDVYPQPAGSAAHMYSRLLLRAIGVEIGPAKATNKQNKRPKQLSA